MMVSTHTLFLVTDLAWEPVITSLAGVLPGVIQREGGLPEKLKKARNMYTFFVINQINHNLRNIVFL